MKLILRSALVLSAALVVGGCSSVEITAPPLQVVEEIDFHSSLGIDLSRMTRLESGVYIEDLVEGNGPQAEVENTVVVDYEGFIATTGLQFVADREAQIILGVGEIPAGMDLALQGMKTGGRRRAVVPPLLGYGRFNSGPIPGGSVLVYDLELVQIVGVTP